MKSSQMPCSIIHTTLKALLVLLAIPVSISVAQSSDSSEGLGLKGARIAIIVAEGYHDHEFWFPYYRFKEEGAEVIVAGPKKGTIYGEGLHGKDGLPANIPHTVEEIMDQEFDLIYLPGGLWAPMTLRVHRPTIELVKKAMKEDTLVAAICHASWILVSADEVKDRKIACPSDMAVDVTNAGGIYVKDRCVRDGNLITAIYFGYLPEHFRVLMPALRGKILKKE